MYTSYTFLLDLLTFIRQGNVLYTLVSIEMLAGQIRPRGGGYNHETWGGGQIIKLSCTKRLGWGFLSGKPKN